MDQYPHIYLAGAQAAPEGAVTVTSPGLESIATTPPPQYGGPEGTWSPETLLVASVADCFILTFRAIAKVGRFEWLDLQCSAEGILERVERVTKFTRFNLEVTLVIPPGSDRDKAEHLLEKAESLCLITNSLDSETHLEMTVTTAPAI